MKLDSTTARSLLSGIRNVRELRTHHAACLYGSRVAGYARKSSDWDLLVIAESYPNGLRYHQATNNNLRLTILAVDKTLFELDCTRGTLGEFVAGRILSPYLPLKNAGYIHEMELETKHRVTREELDDLIVEYGELARGIVVRPEFIALSRASKRAKVFLPARRSFFKTYAGRLKDENLSQVTPGYEAALHRLEQDGLVHFDDKGAIFTEKYLDRAIQRRESQRVVNIVELSRRAISSYLMHGRATLASVDTFANELMRTVSIDTLPDLQARGVEDPRRYLFLKTETGLVAFNEKASVEELAKKLHPGAAISVEPLGGVLNDVYLLIVGKQRFVAKHFTDWHGFKWFILNIVSLGTKNFTLSGKARLSNEYGLSEYLSEHGVSVPAIQHVSMPDRIIIREYIDGNPATELVRKAASASRMSDQQIEMARALGEYMASVHKLEMAIGDSKPENFQLSNGRIYLLDLEQGARPGDKSWDVSEFLYYSGHYVLAGILKGGFREFVKYFVDGYLKNGDATVLRNASSLKYSKVFSIWTPPPIILEVTQTLRNARPT